MLPKPLRATRWTPARQSVTTHGVQPCFGVRVAQRTRSGAEEEMPALRVLRRARLREAVFRHVRARTRTRTCTRAHTCMRGRTRAVSVRARTRCADAVHGLGARRGRERCGSAFCACHSGGTRTCQRHGCAARGRALPELAGRQGADGRLGAQRTLRFPAPIFTRTLPC